MIWDSRSSTRSLLNGLLAIVFSAGVIGALSGMGFFEFGRKMPRSDCTYSWYDVAMDLRILASFVLGALVCDMLPDVRGKVGNEEDDDQASDDSGPDDEICVSQLNLVLL
eukprot:TRINITY_DN1279_c0_g1_i1.p3 TRINITY_DN1279_c0_g1~~TRINITY_DN1279_c0_g1_i1.p3  ORF type:complete len:110 (-),score=23.87 TRINITY_DN1279_c0_g1_i1:241-570(-)